MPESLLEIVKNTLEEMKAIDPVVLEVRGSTSVTDFMVIATGSSSRHVRSMAEEIVKASKHNGVQPLGVEGEQQGDWVLVDLGDIVVHLMQEETRRFYNLEHLWEPPVKREGTS